MKRIFFLLIVSVFMVLRGFAQPSAAAPTPPTRDAANVVSLFSDAYTNISGADFFPGWGQGTVVSDVTVAGNATKLYSGLDYQGLQLSSSLDISAMDVLHMDVWTTNVASLNVFLINTSPSTVQQSATVSPTSGNWYAVDIPLSNYSNIALNNIGQLMFTGSGSFYMDNLYFYKATAPYAAAPTPTRDAANVVSLFSDAYTNVSGTNFFPDWGQSTVVSDLTISGNTTKLYANLNYQGIQLSSSLNVSTMENLHVDVWTTDVSSLVLKLINTSPATVEQGYTITPTLNNWYSIDIPLSSYNNIALNNVGQLMFVGSGTFYMDNLYFWKSANAPTLSNFTVPAKVFGDAAFTLTAPTSNSTGAFTYTSGNTSVATISGNTVTLTGVGTSIITATQAAAGSYGSGTITSTLVVTSPPPATAAPTPPTRSASNVISLFSNAYSNVTVDTWSAGWDQADVADVTVATNATKLYTNLNYAGVEFTSATLDVNNMEKFHIDIWTPDATVFKVKLVDFGANGIYDGGDDVAYEIVYTPALSQWVSYDIAMSDFTGLVTKGHLAQIVLSASNSTVYVDNVYFWRANPAPTFGAFTVPAKTLGAASFSLTAPTSNSTGAITYTSGNTNVATISGTTVTIIGAGTSVITATQAAAGIYGSGSTTANFVVTGPAAPTTAAPNPPTRVASDVISVFSGAYSNLSGTDFFPNWGQNAFCEDTTIAGNLTHKYPNLNYHGIQLANSTDVSGMTTLHLDIWTPNCQTLDLYLINTISGVVERKVSFNPPFAGWQSYDVALTQFSSQGLDLANVAQFKLVSTPFGGTTVYIDNMYFWKPAGAPSYGSFAIPSKVVGDAKFKITPPTSSSPVAFTYTSSNTSVATISNDSIIVVGAGTSTITASQAAGSGYLAGSKSSLFTVDFAPPAIAAPQPPVRNTGDVISLFSNSYINVTVDTWSAYWDNANVADVQIAGNDNKKYTNLVFSGIEFTSSPIDATLMTTFHLDAWTPDATTFKIKLVDFGANGTFGGGDDTEQELTYTPTLGGWNTYDIPMSDFSGLASRAHLAQMILVASNSTVYVDNVYFYKGSALSPTISIVQPTCTTSTGSVTVTSSTTGLTFSKDGTTYQSSGVFSGLAAGNYNITSKNSSGVVSQPAVATLISTTPAAPAGITGTRNVSKCDSIQNYAVVSPVSGYTYTWAVTGTGNSIRSGQGTANAVIAVNVAGTITVKAAKCVTAGPTVSFAVTKATPTTPTVTYTSTNVCSYTNSAFTTTGEKDTFKIKQVAFATGYYVKAPAGSTVQKLNDTTYTVLFADTTTLSATDPRTVNVYSLSACDTSLAKVITLTRTAAATPGVIYNSFTAGATTGPAAVTAVCSIVGGAGTTYKIRKVASAITYDWSVKSGANMIVTHENTEGGINDTAITVQYLAGFVSDSIFVKSVNGCGASTAKGIAVSATKPAAPASITAALVDNSCGARVYRYTAPDLIAATTTAGAATGYLWTLASGSVGSTGVLDSGTVNSKVIRVRYSSNAAAVAGDSIRVAYASTCGYSASKALKLTNAALNAPAAPASITAALVDNSCGARVYRYSAPALPAATTTAGAATGYLWTLAGGSVGSTGVVDSGTVNSQVIRVRYSSNAAALAGDSIKLSYTSGCGTSPYKALKLTNAVLNAPAAPLTLTITSLGNVNCGQPRYRYAAPAVLPAGTSTTGAPTGYNWSFYGTLGATFVVDSGSLSTSVVTGYFTSTAARVAGDSVKVRYSSGCGFSTYKAAALTNVATSTVVPAAPASITATLVSNVCGARVYRYTAPALPVGSATAAAATGYTWSLPTGSAVALSASVDSGVLSGAGARYIRLKFTNNGAAVAGDSVRVRYTSACGVSANKALKLTNLALVCLVGSPVYSKGTNGNDIINAEIYPNPNSGNFTLTVQTGIMTPAIAKVQIIDMYGRVVNQFTAQNNNGSIHMNISDSKLVNGMYSVKYSIGTISNSIKMMIKK